MKSLLFRGCAIALCAAVALASHTYTNKRFTDTNGTMHNKLTLDVATGTMSIPTGTVPLVYDANGMLVSPQPRLDIEPQEGTDRDVYTITDTSGNFPDGCTVVVPQLSVSDDAPPSASFGHT